MKIANTFFAGVLLLAFGCSSSKQDSKPKEFVNIPINIASNAIPADSQEKYMSNPVLRAYAVGRYIDPQNSNVMHEEHTVYREISSSSWVLTPQPDAEPITAAQKLQQDRYAQPVLGQINRAINDVRIARDDMEKNRKIVEAQKNELDTRKKEIDALRRSNSVMAENIKMLSSYVEKIDKKVETMDTLKNATVPRRK